MSYTRAEWIAALYHKVGNLSPHPWMMKHGVAWTELETAPYSPQTPGALNNLLNTEKRGYGSDLLPKFNTDGDGVKQYPTFEDGIAANIAALLDGFYPAIVSAMRSNDGVPLGSQGQVSQEVAAEFAVWSGGSGYGEEIAQLANSGNLRMYEIFPGRHAGQP